VLSAMGAGLSFEANVISSKSFVGTQDTTERMFVTRADGIVTTGAHRAADARADRVFSPTSL
jgi:hypothetical protein